MATMSKLFVATLLSTSALAAPLVKRAYFTEVVTKTEWVTDYITDTAWINDATFRHGRTHPATAVEAAVAEVSAVTTEVTSSTDFLPTTITPTTTSTTPAMAPVETSMTTTPAVEAPAVTSTMTTSSEIISAALPTTTATTTLAQATATSVQATATASTVAQSAPSTGSTDGTCEGEGDPCEGDVTYWTGGLGACGTVVDTNSDYAIALPYQFMGTLSNTNPYCGRSVTLYNPTSGTMVQATVRDKCMGCVDRAIDCTEVLFNAITDGTGNGRVSGIVWWLN